MLDGMINANAIEPCFPAACGNSQLKSPVQIAFSLQAFGLRAFY
jgi:hypothetical protein